MGTCCCSLNLRFWGQLFLTLWPCHARWTLTMTDLSAAFLLGSLAQEWAAGSETGRSSFLYVWAMVKTSLVFFFCSNVRGTLPLTFVQNILFAANMTSVQNLYKISHFLYIKKCRLRVRFFIRGPWDCQIQKKKVKFPGFQKLPLTILRVTDSVPSTTTLLSWRSDWV